MNAGRLFLYNTKSNVREYVTPKQLALEIQDELVAHGGRINLEALAVRPELSLILLLLVDPPPLPFLSLAIIF
jgi:hypothetical protein